MPKTDVEETDAYFLVSLEVPGIPRDHLHVEVVDNKELIVWGESKDHRKFFQRVFLIPPPVDVNKIEAIYEDKVLHLVLPKAEDVKRKIIPITGEKRSELLERIRKAVGVAEEPAQKAG